MEEKKQEQTTKTALQTKVGIMDRNAQSVLPARQYAYNALHIIFGQTPTKPILEALLSDDSLVTLNALAENAEQPYAQAVEAFENLKSHYLTSEENENVMHDLGLEYTRLFVGPSALPAPPWELVYVTGRRELFQPGVLEIREIYRSVGCLPAESPHVSDDHLGIELDFMRFLCEKTMLALEQDDEEAATQLEQLQRSFLNEHLLTWVPRFLVDFEQAAKEPFYVASAQLLGAYLELEAELLEEVSS